LKKKAVWILILYTIVSSITGGVYIAAKTNANYVWLNLTTVQNQVINITESLIFLLGLAVVRRWGLLWSWRKLVWAGTLLVTFFQLLYLLIVFDVIRNPWFYMFTDVSATFLSTLSFLAGALAIVEVSEPGFEAITYALLTTANNATIPLSSVISYQLMSLFPSLNTQEGLTSDTLEVRKEFALVLLITVVNPCCSDKKRGSRNHTSGRNLCILGKVYHYFCYYLPVVQYGCNVFDRGRCGYFRMLQDSWWRRMFAK